MRLVSCKRAKNGQDGVTLIECIVATVILVIGVLAVMTLMDVGMRHQSESSNATAANALARAKVEQLRNSAPTSAERCPGGGTASNVTGFYDALPAGTPKFYRRWQIVNAPDPIPNTGGQLVPDYTQWVKVAVVAVNTNNVRLPAVEITTLMPKAPIVSCP